MVQFTQKAAERTKAAVTSYERDLRGRPPAGLRSGGAAEPTLVGKVGTGGITARVGDTPGSGTVTLYRFASADSPSALEAIPGDLSVTAYNLAEAAIDGDSFVPVSYGLGVWWVGSTKPKEEEQPNDDPYIKSGFMVTVGGTPDTGTLTFAATCDNPDDEEDPLYGEFTIDIVSDSADDMLAKIHTALGFTTPTEKAQVKTVSSSGVLKYNSFNFMSTLASFGLAIIAADLTVHPGGWPNYARIFQAIIADLDDEDVGP